VKRLAHALIGLVMSMSCACSAPESEPKPTFARREFKQFQRDVYPVLLRDCGFAACHGAPDRFFRVWGPGRSRLATGTGVPEPFDLPTGAELSTSYSLALSMIDEAHPERSLLMRKPLAVAAGGAGHLGVDSFGRDVYRTTEDSGFVALAGFVRAQPPPPVTEPTP
jgi:hypothetical protein